MLQLDAEAPRGRGHTAPSLTHLGCRPGKGCPETWPTAHVQIMALNESPVLLLLDPMPQPGQRDLPVRLFESGARPPSSNLLYLSSPYAFGLFTPACQLLQARAMLTEGEPAGNGRGSPLLQNTEAFTTDVAELRVKEGVASLSFVQANFHIEVRTPYASMLCMMTSRFSLLLADARHSAPCVTYRCNRADHRVTVAAKLPFSCN